MSKLKPNPRLKPVATVKVKTRALLAQGGGEVFHAHGCSENAVRAAQSSILDGDVSALKLLHRNKDGRVVGTTTYTVPTVDADAEVSVVDRDGQSGLRAISQKMEAVVAHSVQQAKRKGWSSEAKTQRARNADFCV